MPDTNGRGIPAKVVTARLDEDANVLRYILKTYAAAEGDWEATFLLNRQVWEGTVGTLVGSSAG